MEQDLEKARHWFERAAENGHEDAARILATMGDHGKPSAKALPGDDIREAEELVAALPPIIASAAETGAGGLSQDWVGGKDCPNGHGPLQDWNGDLRCWVCGWPDESSETKQRSTIHPPTDRRESASENLGRRLGIQIRSLFEKPSGAGAAIRTADASSPKEKEKENKPGIGCDSVWVVAGIVYLLARSCS